MQKLQLEIANPRGLHAETCARIVAIAERCRCKVSLVSRKRRANARNIVAVMLLTAAIGATVRVEAEGPDEVLVVRQIAMLLADGYGERR